MKHPLSVTLLLVTVAGVPLAIAPELVLESDVTPKLLVLLGSTAGLLLCWHSWQPGAAALLRGRKGRIFAASIGLWIASAGASTLLSQQSGLSLAGSSWRRYGLVTQLALAV